MTKSVRAILTATVLVCGAAAVALCPGCSESAAENAAPQGTAEDILRRAAAGYQALDSYQATFILTQTVSIEGTDQVDTMTVEFKLLRPDKVYARFLDTGIEVVYVSDGEAAFTFVPLTNKYLREDAPGSLDEALANPMLTGAMRGLGHLTFGPFGSRPYEALVEDVETMEVVRTDTAEPEAAHHLVMQQKAGDLDVWLDRDSLRLVRARLNPWKIVDQQRAANPQMPDLKVSIEVKVQPAAAGADIGAEHFTFSPPEGALAVKTLEQTFNVDMTGKPMEDFKLEGLEEGAVWHLSEHKGKVIALAFWASWCEPCRIELPHLQKIYDELKEQGFLLLAVNLNETREKAAAFLKDAKFALPVALDSDGKVGRQYVVMSIPTLVLIGKGGAIEAVHTGYAPGSEKVVRAEIEKLLAGGSLIGGDGPSGQGQ